MTAVTPRPARLAFFGTPDVAVPALAALHAAEDLDVVAVVTNPDRRRGRSKALVAPAVKVAATDLGLPVLQPEKPREIIAQLRALRLDAVAVVAYGAILPDDVLDTGGAGFVNLHFSLLPRWRGAAPVQHALRAGDTVTGVTCFVLDAGMDTGPILRSVEVDIAPSDDTGTLLDRLAELGGPVLVDAIRDLVGGATPTPQPADGATLAPKISTDDVALDFTRPAAELVDLIRSASPRPGAWTTLDGQRFKVLAADLEAGTPGVEPGTIDRAARIATADGWLVPRRVQPAGKAAMDADAWRNGHQPTGKVLGAVGPEADA